MDEKLVPIFCKTMIEVCRVFLLARAFVPVHIFHQSIVLIIQERHFFTWVLLVESVCPWLVLCVCTCLFSIYVCCSINGIHPRPRKVLQLFRLRQINNGVFVKLNRATLNMLKIAEPYITWGSVDCNIRNSEDFELPLPILVHCCLQQSSLELSVWKCLSLKGRCNVHTPSYQSVLEMRTKVGQLARTANSAVLFSGMRMHCLV